MKMYIGTKIIMAEPQECQKDVGNSKVGDPGYKVQYEDGYVSWSPAEAFEVAYRETGGLPFGLALEAMKRGLRVARQQWHGHGLFCGIRHPSLRSDMAVPYIYQGMIVKTEDGEEGLFAPFTPSPQDMLADDWMVVEQPAEEKEEGDEDAGNDRTENRPKTQ